MWLLLREGDTDLGYYIFLYKRETKARALEFCSSSSLEQLPLGKGNYPSSSSSLGNGESNDHNFKFLYRQGRGLSNTANGIHSKINILNRFCVFSQFFLVFLFCIS
jgi:hypothetical protein